MSDEIKVNQEENKCLCQNKSFRKFVVIATGTFVGVFCALSLFAALHKPPMMVHPYGAPGFGNYPHPCPCRMMHHRDFKFDKKFNGEFKKHHPQEAGKPAPFEKNKIENDD